MRRLLILAIFVVGCTSSPDALRIGVKGFTEQRVLGEVLRAHLDAGGYAVARLVECGDTHQCHEALRAGRVDLMVEYTGTGAVYIGLDAETVNLKALRDAYAGQGIRWLDPLGFDNRYAVYVPPAHRARSIEDLAKGRAVRLACPTSYLRRPKDGLSALMARYGLILADGALTIVDPNARYAALLEGRVDAAVGYTTDAAVAALKLRALDDPLGFFPAYRAALIGRAAVLDAHPDLGTHLAALAGRIDDATMRDLNAAVDLEGQRPQQVAEAFLQKAGLLPAEPDAKSGPVVTVAVGDHYPSAARFRLQGALRGVFPKRSIRLEDSGDALGALGTRARFAVVDAAQLYRSPDRKTLEAAVALERRILHVLRRASDAGTAFKGALGIPREGRFEAEMVSLMGKKPAQRAKFSDLVAALRTGGVDAVLVARPAKDSALSEALSKGEFALMALGDWRTPARAASAPFMQPARLAANTYPNQPHALDTISSQLVLVGSAPASFVEPTGGPAAGLRRSNPPLTVKQVEQLADALSVTELPDPTLPTVYGRTPSAPDDSGLEMLDVLLNLFVFLFIGWLLVLTLRSEEDAPA
jgi:osmoprotectant transport system substrate-binding protein